MYLSGITQIPAFKSTLAEMIYINNILKDELKYAQKAVDAGYNISGSVLIRAITESAAAEMVIGCLMNSETAEIAAIKIGGLLNSELSAGNPEVLAARVYNDALRTLNADMNK